MRRPPGLAVVCGMLLVSASRADDPPGPATGEVRLASGRNAIYSVHFDRNSIRASVRSGDHLIAATSSGALLRFDLPGPLYIRERVDPEPVTYLGTGEGGAVIAGYGDGRIVAVDPTTLDEKELFRVADEPQWIGWAPAVKGRKAGLVVATQPSEWPPRKTTLHDMAEGKTISVEDRATAFLIDREGRLWLGSDHGEWGGRIYRVGLVSGKVESIQPPPNRDPRRSVFLEGVYGFLECRDGQVWVFGGSMHGTGSSSIARIGRVEASVLYERRQDVMNDRAPAPSSPCLPITQMVKAEEGLRVFSYDGIFRVDEGLEGWSRVVTREVADRWGRSDLMGTDLSVASVHPPTHASESWILATLADGYRTLDGTKMVPHALPGQLGAPGVYNMVQTLEGLLCFDSDEEQYRPWRPGPKGWEQISLEPPFEADPNGDPDLIAADKEEGRWNWTHSYFGPHGEIAIWSEMYGTDATVAIARRLAGKSVRIGLGRGMKEEPHCFITGDGAIWNISGVRISRHEAGRWKLVSEDLNGRNVSSVRVIDEHGPPWLLFERDRKLLWRLDHDLNGENARLARIDLQESGRPLRIDAAIPLHGPSGSVLLATDTGLRTYDPAGKTITKVELPDMPKPVLAMSRDGLGRLWVVSRDRLLLLELGNKAIETFDRVPGIGRTAVTALVADPGHKDGIVAGLGERGVAFVRVPAP